MHRERLLAKLSEYQPQADGERRTRERIVAFVQQHPDCFERSLSVGHITGSVWLLDAGGQRVLLTHHRKLNRWLQPGGHADGDPDVLAVALREAREESGIACIVPWSEQVFDLDVHPIPAWGDVAAHDHYDIRFLMQASGSDAIVISDESHDLAWFTSDELVRLDLDPSVRRMHRKWRGL